MLNSNPNLPHDSDLEINQNEKLFSRLLSKDTCVANPSFRVYYGGASGAVPFLWESQPGTPKNKLCDTSLPPLTLPPSYQFHSTNDNIKKSSKLKLIHTIFPRLINVGKSHVSPASSVSSSSSSSMSPPPSTPMSSSNSRRRRRRPSSVSSFDSRCDIDDETSFGSPTSTLCFGDGRERRSGTSKGCYSMVIMKNAFSSIVGNGSGSGHQGTA